LQRLLIRLIKNETGYSLVEVMASITILAIAIIPMVAMFDMGLNAASRGSNYDKARALANQQLEAAKSLPYQTVRDSFPNGTPAPSPEVTSSSQSAPDGFSYTVTKRFINSELADSSTDVGLLKITVTVSRGGDTYPSVTGVVAAGQG
jgi:prepilin-type N-terminal cleavage/methylation domain-containing protein